MRHKTIELVVSALSVQAITLALIVAPATAEEYVPGTGWQAFSWITQSLPADNIINKEPFTFSIPGGGCSAVLQVTDSEFAGERFEVFNFGVWTGLWTSNPPGGCLCGPTCPYTEDFDTAYSDNTWSSGALALDNGSYAIQFRLQQWCTNIPGGTAAFRVIFEDCNCNGTDDAQDIANGTSQDCNRNGLPDECDITFLTSQDCNDNGIPDECEPPPCLADITGPLGGVPDGCVDAFDLGAMLGAWCSAVNDPIPPSPPCENCIPANLALADISGAVNVPDGCIDAFDLAKLLAEWCSVAGGNPCGTCFPPP